MTSSESEKPRGRNRFLWLAVGILSAIAIYTGGWFYLAGKVEAGVDETLARTSGTGGQARCSNREARGYPFRIGLFCDEVSFVDGTNAVSVEGDGLRTAAQVYDPFRLVGEMDELRFRIAESSTGLAATARDLCFSARLADTLPERASVTISDLSIDATPESARATTVLRAPAGEAHMRQREGDLDLAVESSQVQLTPPGVAGDIELARLFLDLTVEDGVRFVQSNPQSLRGISVVVRSASVFATEGSGLTVSGPVSVDPDGLVDATLQLEMTNPAEMGNVLARALPDFADQINSAMAGLAMLGDGASLPLTIRKGRARIAFITLGQVPPLL